MAILHDDMKVIVTIGGLCDMICAATIETVREYDLHTADALMMTALTGDVAAKVTMHLTGEKPLDPLELKKAKEKREEIAGGGENDFYS